MTTMSRRNFVRAGVATMIGAEFGAGRVLAAGMAQSAARSESGVHSCESTRL